MAYPEDTYNLFALQKAASYPNSVNMAQFNKETEQMAKKYQPMLTGQQPKTNEQVINDRALQQTQNFAAPSTYKPEPQKITPVNTGGSSTMGITHGEWDGVRDNPETKGVDYLNSLLTTPEEEEKLRKASVANQRIMAVGDALRHIGNIVNTVNYAPAQKFNSPVEEERNRYLQERSRRDKRNQLYMSYQQAKAAQDARMKQLEAQNKLRAELNAAQVQNYKDRAEEYIRHNKEIEALNKSRAEAAAQNAQRNYEHKVETDKRRLDISERRANKSGGGRRSGGTSGYTTVTERVDTHDANGKRTGYRTVQTKTVGGSAKTNKKGKGYGNNNNRGY